jgi:aspartate/methionine/tyrosine aminotransferase
MFPAPRYIEWARRFYGQLPFDLASSGIPQVRHADIGGVAGLDEPNADERLRSAIARFNGVEHGEVVATLGATHALWLAYTSLIAPGDDVLVEEPAYEPLHGIAASVGARVVRFSRAATQQFRLDPDRISRALTGTTRVVAVTNLHNPSGRRTSDEDLRAAALVAEKHGATLLVDEVYAPFDSLVDPEGVWGRTARRLAPNIVTASSLTKGFGLGQQRVGWLLAPADVVRRAEGVLMATCGRLPLEHANVGSVAFAHIVDLASRARAAIGEKRAVVTEWAASRERVSWSAPDEGLFGFLTCADSEDLTQRIEAAAQNGQVVVAPGEFFGVPTGFRLSWSISHELLSEALARLDRFVLRR